MTKRRPDFERRAHDKYFTPDNAILPLLPHLAPCTRFAEPCAGDGRVAKFLNKHGHRCVWASDIAPEGRGIETLNALDVDQALIRRCRASIFITNPPWHRPTMHTLIRHLSSLLPTWILMDADWSFTDFPRKLKIPIAKIVTIGRVKWIEDSPHLGMDNAVWVKFDRRHRGQPRLYWK